MLTIADTLKYYKREDIREEMVRLAENREIAVRYGDKGFGKRPDVLKYKNDVLELARNRATSFHASEELWTNPLLLGPELKTSELNELRIGWDLILDIDCHFFEYSRLAAKLIVDILKNYGIKSISVKFSGNKGFHIGVPFESFPGTIQSTETRLLFPEAPRKIALYLRYLIKEKLADEIMKIERNNFDSVIKKVGKPIKEIVYYKTDTFGERIPMLNVESFLEIDTILIAPRHLFRMPYSLHEKSKLASIPIPASRIMEFSKEEAKPENVIVDGKNLFLDRSRVIRGEAAALLVQAFDFTPRVNEAEEVKSFARKHNFEEIKTPLTKEYFAPCIKNILRGLEDGRKRSVFVLINYLRSLGWSFDSVENLLLEWNKRNKEPLRENYIKSQLQYQKHGNKKILPPNCNNKMYYKDIGVCTPDSLCEKIKNPVNYSIIMLRKRNSNSKSRIKKRKPKPAKTAKTTKPVNSTDKSRGKEQKE